MAQNPWSVHHGYIIIRYIRNQNALSFLLYFNFNGCILHSVFNIQKNTSFFNWTFRVIEKTFDNMKKWQIKNRNVNNWVILHQKHDCIRQNATFYVNIDIIYRFLNNKIDEISSACIGFKLLTIDNHVENVLIPVIADWLRCFVNHGTISYLIFHGTISRNSGILNLKSIVFFFSKNPNILPSIWSDSMLRT